ncbi:MAG: PIN domain-containing protein [Dermatophilaceae bacterium]
MSFPVLLDTCVLYPQTLCDTLLRIAEGGVYRPHWSADILDELRRNLAMIDSVGDTRARRRIDMMQRAFEDAMVTGYSDLVPAMTCHPKDAHVLAAAVVSECQVIVTFNLKDFPPEAVDRHDIEVVHPDGFLLDQLDLYPRIVLAALSAQSRASTRPSLTTSALIASLERCGVPRFATELRRKGDLST